MEILIITGLSGAGKSQALNVCEDMGYFAMDNLPPALLSKFVELSMGRDDLDRAAVVIDLRARPFFKDLSKALDGLKTMGVDFRIIFLEADEDCIIRRYKEKRRPHPLSSDIVEGYRKEKQLTEDLRNRADFVINTSDYKNKDIKNKMLDILGSGEKDILISINSFGFKNGILLDADLVFDVRFIENPYYIKELREENGLSDKVRDFVLKNDVTKTFISKTMNLLNFLIPNYKAEGKSILVIGIGCTGGYHRSVAIACKLAEDLEKAGYKISLRHRDLK